MLAFSGERAGNGLGGIGLSSNFWGVVEYMLEHYRGFKSGISYQKIFSKLLSKESVAYLR